VHLRSVLPCNVPCRHLLQRGMSTLCCSIDGWYVVPSTLYSVTELLLVTPHHLKHCLQRLLELCHLMLLLNGNNPGTSSCLNCMRCCGSQIHRTCCSSCSHAQPLDLSLLVSYGPPWAHYLGGYQDQLLGGPLGLPGLGCTTPVGVEHKDLGEGVLG
jgi:hypothetical protein